MECTHDFKRAPGGMMPVRRKLVHYVRCEQCGLIKREDKLEMFFVSP